MKVLGISYGYHDASATLVIDGQIVAAMAEERLTRQKHDAHFPTYAIRHCLAEGGIGTQDLDKVVFHEDPHTKFTRVITASLAPFPHSRREFVNSAKSWLGNKLWALNTLSARLDLEPEKITYVGHHFSHAAQAFMGSGFERSAILIVDAVGDWSSTALFIGQWVDGRPEIERVTEIAFPHSLGLVYSAITAYLGFRPNDSEATTMALAAFGTPRFADVFREIIVAEPDGTYTVDQRYFNFANFYKGAYTDALVERLGPARESGAPLGLDCLNPDATLSEDEQRFADIAASIQCVLEERILGLCSALHTAAQTENLCLAGGVAFNCVANQRILDESAFTSLYIPPDPGDGGTSVGTALYTAAQTGDLTPAGLCHSAYLGKSFDEGPVLEMIEHVNPAHFRQYMKAGVDAAQNKTWKVERFDREDGFTELCAAVADRLMQGQLVGWFQGNFEMGPRALGNRSLLARPDDLDAARRLSTLVKNRAPYRPYAFSVTDADALALLDIPADQVRFHRWMQLAVPVRPEAADTVRAALHVDHTTRPQVCFAEDNPRYHAILSAFGDRYGKSVLLNTSFNPSGYPLVASPEEALVMFARTDLDVLVLGDALITKVRPD